MRKYTVLWFSGTGNTLLVARMMKASLTGAGLDVDIVEMSQGTKIPAPGGVLIFCWPVYSYGPPRIVKRFMRAMPDEKGAVYLLCTMGGGAGGAIAGARRLLSAKGYDVMGGLELLMPNNYVGGRIPRPDSIQKLLANADKEVQEFAQSIIQEQRIPPATSLVSEILSRATNKAFCLGLPFTAKLFSVSREACTQCGICMKACPVQNISLKEYPVWGKNCEFCLRCLHICPQSAIDIFGAIKKGRPQYVAPETDFLTRLADN